ncbi:hypothetical protein HK097_006282, partial [Rhizophlyctis rosea]
RGTERVAEDVDVLFESYASGTMVVNGEDGEDGGEIGTMRRVEDGTMKRTTDDSYEPAFMRYLRQGQANGQQSAGGGSGFELDAGGDGTGTMKPIRKGGAGSVGGQVATLGRGVELTVGRSGTVKATASPTGGTPGGRTGPTRTSPTHPTDPLSSTSSLSSLTQDNPISAAATVGELEELLRLLDRNMEMEIEGVRKRFEERKAPLVEALEMRRGTPASGDSEVGGWRRGGKG